MADDTGILYYYNGTSWISLGQWRGPRGASIVAPIPGRAPLATDGEEDDHYIDWSTGDIYGPKTAAGWGTVQGSIGQPSVEFIPRTNSTLGSKPTVAEVPDPTIWNRAIVFLDDNTIEYYAHDGTDWVLIRTIAPSESPDQGPYAQPGTAFTVGQLVLPSDSINEWTLADSQNGLPAMGIISSANATEYWVKTSPGVVSWTAHGLDVSATNVSLYYTSNLGAAAITPAGQISQVVYYPIDANSIRFVNWSPAVSGVGHLEHSAHITASGTALTAGSDGFEHIHTVSVGAQPAISDLVLTVPVSPEPGDTFSVWDILDGVTAGVTDARRIVVDFGLHPLHGIAGPGREAILVSAGSGFEFVYLNATLGWLNKLHIDPPSPVTSLHATQIDTSSIPNLNGGAATNVQNAIALLASQTQSAVNHAAITVTTDGQTSFTGVSVANAANTRLVINGITYRPTADYTIAGTTLNWIGPFSLSTTDTLDLLFV